MDYLALIFKSKKLLRIVRERKSVEAQSNWFIILIYIFVV